MKGKKTLSYRIIETISNIMGITKTKISKDMGYTRPSNLFITITKNGLTLFKIAKILEFYGLEITFKITKIKNKTK